MQPLVVFVFVMAVARGQVRYSIPEEMTKGSLVGNIVQDFGLDVKRLKSGRARIFTEDSHVGGTGTLQHVYNYEVCRTTDSRKSDLKYGRPCSESIISLDTSGTQTLTHAQRGKMNNDDSFDQLLVLFVFVMAVARGQVRYSIPEEMTKGSLVGNIVQDLGLDVKRLKSGRARIFTEDSLEDNGQPSRSATVNVNVAVADSFPEVLSEFTDFTQDKDYSDNLTFYLVLALAVVSFLFIVSIIAILSVKCYRWRRERMFYKSGANLPVIPYYPPLYADVGGTGTLQHVYNYEVCRTTDSRKSDLKYGRPCSESIISLETSGTQTLTRAQRGELNNEDSFDQWRIFDADFIMANAASPAVLLCHGRCARAGPLFYSRRDDKGLAGGKYRSGSRFGCKEAEIWSSADLYGGQS
ncbi:protocadherin beta-16-like protein [Labeo rohita]|uniref:Protocadherin beta-16-like protein n=1 Tax=Labeo rohita TaxID=84645 RepID=A0A498LTX8_LABRO|nr:protocadherin beta-16-like protein [Labeo rohita]